MESRIRRRLTRTLLLIASLLVAGPAAANYFCQGTIDSVEVSPSGAVEAYSAAAGLNYVTLCAIGATANGVSSDTCKAILAVLLAAHASGAQVQWAFSDSLTCTTHPAWAWLTGWYYGPNIM
jgi:hypothetical protein